LPSMSQVPDSQATFELQGEPGGRAPLVELLVIPPLVEPPVVIPPVVIPPLVEPPVAVPVDEFPVAEFPDVITPTVVLPPLVPPVRLLPLDAPPPLAKVAPGPAELPDPPPGDALQAATRSDEAIPRTRTSNSRWTPIEESLAPHA